MDDPEITPVLPFWSYFWIGGYSGVMLILVSHSAAPTDGMML